MTSSLSLLELLKKAAVAFEANGIKYAVSGGLAQMVWGFIRATRDIDVLVSVPGIRLSAVTETLSGFGWQGDTREALSRLRTDNYMVFPCGDIEVEVFTPALPYHEQALGRRVRKDVEGVPIWFLTAEDLIVLKLIFHRAKDLADVKGTAATLGDRLDRTYIQKTMQDLLPAGDPRLAEMMNLL